MKKQGLGSVSVILALLLTVWGPWVMPVKANGNGVLGSFANIELQGDVASAGVGLRGTGSGMISLSGIPAGASVYRAFLYWATLGNANTYTAPAINSQEVAGQLIGTSGDTCWAVQHNYVYRADVTALVSGNGDYTVSGLPKDLSSGNDSQGASLVVLYAKSGLPVRTISIYDGAVALDFTRHSYTNTIAGFTPDSPVMNAHITFLIGDGQAKWDTGNVNVNGTSVANNTFSGIDGPFWGTHTFDVTNLVTEAPVTTTINNNDPDNPASPDCLLWAATVLSVTTSAPPANNLLSGSFQQTLFGDVTTAGIGLRGVGQGSIDVSGVPASSGVSRAFLYWATIGNSASFTSPQFNGTQVDGAVIGISADTCWGALRNFVYRADVTGLVAGNGAYSIAGLPSNLSTGNDTQGAALVVVYYQPGLYRTVLINDGAVTLDLNVHTYTDRIGDFTADQPGAQAHITYLIGDGQSQWNSGNVNFEGKQIAQNVFNGVDGNYWGTLTFDVSGMVTEPDATTTINNNDPTNPSSPDCLLWAGTVLSVETEPPPPLDFVTYLPMLRR